MAEQTGPQAAWLSGHLPLSGHFMSVPRGDHVPALLTRRGSGTVTYAIGSSPVSFRQGQVLEGGKQMVFNISSTLPTGRCSALTPLVLLPGDGPAALGDLQWMLCPAPGHWPAPSGCGRGAPGAQQRALSLPVH